MAGLHGRVVRREVRSCAGRRSSRRPAGGWCPNVRQPSRRPVGVRAGGTPDWRRYLLQRLDDTSRELGEECHELARCTYGAADPVRVRHPLSRAVPLLAALLDMPTMELPGDHHMPRVQDGAFGASERFAVSPGRESEGYLELPGGPSGHPLSPFFRSGFDDWAAGRPTPFLPGPAAHKLSLVPQPAQ